MAPRLYRKIIASAFLLLFTAREILPSSAALAAVSPADPVSVETRSPAAFSIPSALGSLDSAGPAAKGPLVVHLETLHGNYETQKSIHALLDYLHGRYGIKTVLVEGTSGKLVPELLRLFPGNKNLTLRAADRLAREGLAKGADLFLIENPEAEGFGVEDLEVYARSRKLMKTIYAEQPAAVSFLNLVDKRISALEGKALNEKLRRFLDAKEAYGRQGAEPETWFPVLRAYGREFLGMDLNDPASQFDWPMLTRYFRILSFEKGSDPKALAREKQLFLETVKPLLAGDPALSAQAGRILGGDSRGAGPEEENAVDSFFLKRLLEELPGNFEFGTFPNLVRWFGALGLASEIDQEALGIEMDRLSRLIENALARSAKERELLAFLRDAGLLRKLITLEMSSREFMKPGLRPGKYRPAKILARLERLGGEISDLGEADAGGVDTIYRQALAFYQLALVRDRKMAENAERLLRQNASAGAVLVTGGFHSGALEAYFREKGCDYRLVRPRVDALDPRRDRSVYERSIREDLPFERATLETSSPLLTPERAAAHGASPVYELSHVLRAASLTALEGGDEAFRLWGESVHGRVFGYRPVRADGTSTNLVFGESGGLFPRFEIRTGRGADDAPGERLAGAWAGALLAASRSELKAGDLGKAVLEFRQLAFFYSLSQGQPAAEKSIEEAFRHLFTRIYRLLSPDTKALLAADLWRQGYDLRPSHPLAVLFALDLLLLEHPPRTRETLDEMVQAVEYLNGRAEFGFLSLQLSMAAVFWVYYEREAELRAFHRLPAGFAKMPAPYNYELASLRAFHHAFHHRSGLHPADEADFRSTYPLLRFLLESLRNGLPQGVAPAEAEQVRRMMEISLVQLFLSYMPEFTDGLLKDFIARQAAYPVYLETFIGEFPVVEKVRTLAVRYRPEILRAIGNVRALEHEAGQTLTPLEYDLLYKDLFRFPRARDEEAGTLSFDRALRDPYAKRNLRYLASFPPLHGRERMADLGYADRMFGLLAHVIGRLEPHGGLISEIPQALRSELRENRGRAERDALAEGEEEDGKTDGEEEGEDSEEGEGIGYYSEFDGSIDSAYYLLFRQFDQYLIDAGFHLNDKGRPKKDIFRLTRRQEIELVNLYRDGDQVYPGTRYKASELLLASQVRFIFRKAKAFHYWNPGIGIDEFFEAGRRTFVDRLLPNFEPERERRISTLAHKMIPQGMSKVVEEMPRQFAEEEVFGAEDPPAENEARDELKRLVVEQWDALDPIERKVMDLWLGLSGPPMTETEILNFYNIEPVMLTRARHSVEEKLRKVVQEGAYLPPYRPTSKIRKKPIMPLIVIREALRRPDIRQLLTEKQLAVLEGRYGGEPRTLEDIMGEVKVTKERVRHLEADGLTIIQREASRLPALQEDSVPVIAGMYGVSQERAWIMKMKRVVETVLRDGSLPGASLTRLNSLVALSILARYEPISEELGIAGEVPVFEARSLDKSDLEFENKLRKLLRLLDLLESTYAGSDHPPFDRLFQVELPEERLFLRHAAGETGITRIQLDPPIVRLGRVINGTARSERRLTSVERYFIGQSLIQIYPKVMLYKNPERKYRQDMLETEVATREPGRSRDILMKALDHWEAKARSYAHTTMLERIARIRKFTAIIGVELPTYFVFPMTSEKLPTSTRISLRRGAIFFSTKLLEALDPENESHLDLIAFYLNRDQSVIEKFKLMIANGHSAEETFNAIVADIEHKTFENPGFFFGGRDMRPLRRFLSGLAAREARIRAEIVSGIPGRERAARSLYTAMQKRIREAHEARSTESITREEVQAAAKELEKVALAYQSVNQKGKANVYFRLALQMYHHVQEIDPYAYYPYLLQEQIIYFMLRAGMYRGVAAEFDRLINGDLPAAISRAANEDRDVRLQRYTRRPYVADRVIQAMPHLLYKLMVLAALAGSESERKRILSVAQKMEHSYRDFLFQYAIQMFRPQLKDPDAVEDQWIPHAVLIPRTDSVGGFWFRWNIRKEDGRHSITVEAFKDRTDKARPFARLRLSIVAVETRKTATSILSGHQPALEVEENALRSFRGMEETMLILAMNLAESMKVDLFDFYMENAEWSGPLVDSLQREYGILDREKMHFITQLHIPVMSRRQGPVYIAKEDIVDGWVIHRSEIRRPHAVVSERRSEMRRRPPKKKQPAGPYHFEDELDAIAGKDRGVLLRLQDLLRRDADNRRKREDLRSRALAQAPPKGRKRLIYEVPESLLSAEDGVDKDFRKLRDENRISQQLISIMISRPDDVLRAVERRLGRSEWRGAAAGRDVYEDVSEIFFGHIYPAVYVDAAGPAAVAQRLGETLGRTIYSGKAGLVPPARKPVLGVDDKHPLVYRGLPAEWKETELGGSVVLHPVWWQEISSSPRALYRLLASAVEAGGAAGREPAIAVEGDESLYDRVEKLLLARNGLSASEKNDVRLRFSGEKLRRLIRVIHPAAGRIDAAEINRYVEKMDFGAVTLLPGTDDAAGMAAKGNFFLDPRSIHASDMEAAVLLVPALAVIASRIRKIPDQAERERRLNEAVSRLLPAASAGGRGFTILLEQFLKDLDARHVVEIMA